MSISSKATGLRPGVCTSTTRPTAPYTGQIIFETDTGYLRVWDGAAWDYLSQWQGATTNLPISDIGKAWTSYTPALTATTTNPTLGSGSTVQGGYVQINKLVIGTAYFAFGTSGVAAGSGDYFVSLPVTSVASTAANRGNCWLYDASAATGWSAVPQISTTTTVQLYKSTGDATIAVGSGNPFTWAANDQIRLFFVYEAA